MVCLCPRFSGGHGVGGETGRAVAGSEGVARKASVMGPAQPGGIATFMNLATVGAICESG